jgi:hypothetical protein
MFLYEIYKKYFCAKRLLTFDCRSILRSLNNKGYPPLYVLFIVTQTLFTIEDHRKMSKRYDI